jgi:hypothetical protein
LSQRDSLKLNPPPARPPAPLQLERHFMGPKREHLLSARRDQEEVRAQSAPKAGPSGERDELLPEARHPLAAPLLATHASAPLPFSIPPTAAHTAAPHQPNLSPGARPSPGPSSTGFLPQRSSSAPRLPVSKGIMRRPSQFRPFKKGILRRPSSPVSPRKPAA